MHLGNLLGGVGGCPQKKKLFPGFVDAVLEAHSKRCYSFQLWASTFFSPVIMRFLFSSSFPAKALLLSETLEFVVTNHNRALAT